jgi:hypothetical protein
MLTQEMPLLADSGAVRSAYYRRRIRLLKEDLGRLTILEHPREIRSICRKIIIIQNRMRATPPGSGHGVNGRTPGDRRHVDFARVIHGGDNLTHSPGPVA